MHPPKPFVPVRPHLDRPSQNYNPSAPPVYRPAPSPAQPGIHPPAPNRSAPPSTLQVNQFPKSPLTATSTGIAIQMMRHAQNIRATFPNHAQWQALHDKGKTYGAEQTTHDWLRIAEYLGMAVPSENEVFGHGSKNSRSGGPKKSAQLALSNYIDAIKMQARTVLKLEEHQLKFEKIKNTIGSHNLPTH